MFSSLCAFTVKVDFRSGLSLSPRNKVFSKKNKPPRQLMAQSTTILQPIASEKPGFGVTAFTVISSDLAALYKGGEVDAETSRGGQLYDVGFLYGYQSVVADDVLQIGQQRFQLLLRVNYFNE